MIIIEIPYSPVNLMIFTGENERSVFDLKVKHQYPEWEGSEDADGMHFQNHVFIEDIENKETLLHETVHFLEWLFGYMEIEDESEFKACISSCVILEVLK